MHKSIAYPLWLVFYEIILYLSNDMYLPALPEMMNHLQLTQTEAQLTLTFWFLGSASMPLFVGIFSERFGRRPILLGGAIIYLIATIFCAVANEVNILLFARAVEGAMVPTMLVAGYASIHERYEKKHAISILALMGSISVLAPGFGPFLGSLVLFYSNWRAIFWLIALGTLISAVALYKVMPETISNENKMISLSVILREWWSLVTNPLFMRLLVVLGCIFAGFIAWITSGPLLVIDSFAYSALIFGLSQIFVFAPNIFGNQMVRVLLNYLRVSQLIDYGLLISFISALLMLFLCFSFPSSLSMFILPMMGYSFGSALCFSSLNRLIIEASNVSMGSRVAMFIVFLNLFAVLGSGMASVFFNGSTLSLAILISIAAISAYIIYDIKRSA